MRQKNHTAIIRRLIRCNEILEGGLASQATVILPGPFCYFDMKQSDDPDKRGYIWAGIVTLEKVYSTSPAHPLATHTRTGQAHPQHSSQHLDRIYLHRKRS